MTPSKRRIFRHVLLQTGQGRARYLSRWCLLTVEKNCSLLLAFTDIFDGYKIKSDQHGHAKISVTTDAAGRLPPCLWLSWSELPRTLRARKSIRHRTRQPADRWAHPADQRTLITVPIWFLAKKTSRSSSFERAGVRTRTTLLWHLCSAAWRRPSTFSPMKNWEGRGFLVADNRDSNPKLAGVWHKEYYWIFMC